MARRTLPEINAGSMADIAFLLLIFFLVTTTMDTDEGILRLLPPPVPPDFENTEIIIERNVYIVLVNARDELLVEGEYMKIDKLKGGAKKFLIGDGVFRDLPEDPNLPVKNWVRKAELEARIDELTLFMNAAKTDDEKKGFADAIDRANRKLSAVKLLGEYKELPNSAVISMQNDNQTSYNMYVQVNNELEAAVGELRDEISLEKFGMTFTQLAELANHPELKDQYRDKFLAVREVVPQRISEAEPRQSRR
jgi:hypothetical protein